MARFRLVFQFDGRAYYGWQRQHAGQPSVQGTAEAAIADLVGQPVSLVGASRTDRGVHARYFPAHADLATRLDGEELRRAIDFRLPEDIALLEVEQVASDYHCRYQAVGKCYAYRIHNSRRRAPLRRYDAAFEPRTLDCDAMRRASACFLGRHDFSAFATLLSEHPDRLTSPADPSNPNMPVGNLRTIFGLSIIRHGESLAFFVFGDGFLRNMVRCMVGTLRDVGLGEIAPEEVGNILRSGDRRKAGANFPGQGLTLERVFFEQPELQDWLKAARSFEQRVVGQAPMLKGAPLELCE